MKRLLMLLIMLLNLSILGVAHADYPDYHKGNTNYPICGGHMGYAQFIDMSSVKVDALSDSEYKITVSIIAVGNADRGNTVIDKFMKEEWIYNVDELKMYIQGPKGRTYIPPVGSMAETGHYYVGEMAFYIATGEKFYGGKQWFNADTQKYTKANCDVDRFYAIIDKARKE